MKHSRAHRDMMDLAQSFLMKRLYISLLWMRRRNRVVIPLGM